MIDYPSDKTKPVWPFASMPDAYHRHRQHEDNDLGVWLMRANLLASMCNVPTREIFEWQKDSGLCPSDFWYFANVINSGWLSYDELKQLSSKIEQAINRITVAFRG